MDATEVKFNHPEQVSKADIDWLVRSIEPDVKELRIVQGELGQAEVQVDKYFRSSFNEHFYQLNTVFEEHREGLQKVASQEEWARFPLGSRSGYCRGLWHAKTGLACFLQEANAALGRPPPEDT